MSFEGCEMNKIVIFVLAVLMVSLPFMLRMAHDNPTIPGVEQYYHLSANNMEPYTFLVKFCPFPLFLPAVLTVLSFVVLALLIRKIVKNPAVESWILLVFALSPTFISAGFFGGRAVFALLCILLGSYVLLTKYRYISIIFFILAGLSGIFAIIASAAFLIGLTILYPDIKKLTVSTLALLFLIFIALPQPPSKIITGFLSDFGGLFGTSIFVVLLALVAAIVLWSNKSRYYLLFAVLFFSFLISIFFAEFLIYANVFACALAGYSLGWLAQREWTLKFLRNASLLVLFCGLLFSSVAHVVAIADTPPDPEFFELIDVPPGTFVASPDYGFWIEYAGHETVADPFVKSLPDYRSRLKNLDYLFSTNSLDDAKELLTYYNVSYVLVEEDSTGLGFLVKNAETFKRVNQTDSLSVWRVK